MIQPNPIQDTVCTKIEEILEIKKKEDKEFCKNRKRDEMIISGLKDITNYLILIYSKTLNLQNPYLPVQIDKLKKKNNNNNPRKRF